MLHVLVRGELQSLEILDIGAGKRGRLRGMLSAPRDYEKVLALFKSPSGGG